MKESLYVDELLTSAPSDSAAIEMRKEVQELLERGSFHLRKWRSNSQEVLKSIPVQDQAADSLLNLDDSSQVTTAPTVKTLGVAWEARSDTFRFVYTSPSHMQFTKRRVLSKMASIYDPRGQISPFTIRARIMFQDVCVSGVSWDEPLPSAHVEKWQRWFSELPELGNINIDRCFKDDCRPAEDAQLTVHTFTDASAHATAAASYVRAEYPDGHVKVSLAFGKARTAPQKKVTIPKLELRGAVLGMRISKVVSDALSIPTSKHFYSTDSMNVAYWVRSNAKNFTIDVANRIAEIQADSSGDQWQHVPGQLNPADYGTRGIKANDLAESSRWWHGPEFLQQPQECWPRAVITVPKQLPEELRKKPLMNFATIEEEFSLSPSRYSSWMQLVRLTGWCLRFINLTRARLQKLADKAEGSKAMQEIHGARVTVRHGDKGQKSTAVPELSVEELRRAENKWIAKAQHEAYPDTVQRLRSGKQLRTSDPLVKLNPGLDTSYTPAVMVLGGRLKFAQHLQPQARQPLILPSHHRVTELIVQHEDQRCHHDAGAHLILSNLRQRYWIVHGVAAVKAVIRRCTCSTLVHIKYTLPGFAVFAAHARACMHALFLLDRVSSLGSEQERQQTLPLSLSLSLCRCAWWQ